MVCGQSVATDSTPWHVIEIPGIDLEVDLKNYFERLKNYGIRVLTQKIEGVTPEFLDKVMGELGLPDLGTLTDELINKAAERTLAEIFDVDSPSDGKINSSSSKI